MASDAAAAPRPPWRSFADPLFAYRHEALEPSLRALCVWRARVTARQGGAQRAFRARLDEALRPALSAWYGRGWSATDDALAFTRHVSLAAVDQLPNHTLGPEDARVLGALGALRHRVAALVATLRCCAAPDGAPRTAAGCVVALERALAALARLGPRPDVAPSLAADLTAWTLEAHGVALRDAPLPALPHVTPSAYGARFEVAMRLVAEASGTPLAALAAERPWAARILRPAPGAEETARAATEGIRNAKEAWEALAARGVIPDAWVGDPSRSYANPSRSLPNPPTVAACVRLAADVPGVQRAEALAGEALARLRPWGAAPATMRRWFFATHAELAARLTCPAPLATLVALTRFYTRTSPLEEPYDVDVWRDEVASRAAELRALGVARDAHDEAAVRAAAEALRPPPALREERDTAAAAVASLWVAGRCWAALREGGLRLPTRDELAAMGAGLPHDATLPTDARGAPARLAALPDPFEPLLEVFALGYAVRGSLRVPFLLVASLG